MSERRRHPRISKPVNVTHRMLQQALRAGSRIKNISESGIRIPIIRKLEPGTTIQLEIRLVEFQEPIVTMGKVIWLRTRNDVDYPFEAGIKFLELSLADRNKIRNSLSKGGHAEIEWIG